MRDKFNRWVLSFSKGKEKTYVYLMLMIGVLMMALNIYLRFIPSTEPEPIKTVKDITTTIKAKQTLLPIKGVSDNASLMELYLQQQNDKELINILERYKAILEVEVPDAQAVIDIQNELKQYIAKYEKN